MIDEQFIRNTEQTAVDRWGPTHQLLKAAEECGELIQAVMKLLVVCYDPKTYPEMVDHILEEAADVTILTDQIGPVSVK